MTNLQQVSENVKTIQDQPDHSAGVNKDEDTLTCGYCGEVFRNHGSLINHMNNCSMKPKDEE